MQCTKCGGEVWDNRSKKASGEFSAKSPDYACKDKNCKHAVWETTGAGGEKKEASKPEEHKSYKVVPMNDPLGYAVTLACKSTDTKGLLPSVWAYYKGLKSMLNGTYNEFSEIGEELTEPPPF